MKACYGFHETGSEIRIFYTPLKTKSAAKKAALQHFGEGLTTINECHPADKEILSQVLYMKLTLHKRDCRVLEPKPITTRKRERGHAQLENEVNEFSALYNISEDEAFARIKNDYNFSDLVANNTDLYSDIPF